MRELFHPNVITLRHAFYTQGDKQDEIYLNVVMDYMPETVYRVSDELIMYAFSSGVDRKAEHSYPLL